MDKITAEQLPALYECVAEVFAEKKDELCAMDANMGDGDLGLTMQKGYAALPDLIREEMQEDVGKTLMKAGMRMASVVPSTMGTLMASGIMVAGKALKGKNEMGPADLSAYFTAFAAGIQKRGKCSRGERTILDAVGAAADRASACLEATPDAGLAQVMDAAVSGAEAGVEASRAMMPKYGKAAVFAAKAIGIPDQGATAGMYMLKGMARYIR